MLRGYTVDKKKNTHFVSALAYPCDLSVRTENLVHKNTVQYKCVFFSLKPDLWSHRCLGSKRHPPLPTATPAITHHCISLTNTENKWFYPLLIMFNAGQLQSSGFRIPTGTPSYVWHHHFYIKSWNLGTKSVMFAILLCRFPWISAHYLSGRQPHQGIIALYTCCKYRVSRHGCQTKFPCSTFVTICSTSVGHEPAHDTLIYCFLVTAGGWLEMFRLAITMCPFTFKVTEFPLVSAYKQSNTTATSIHKGTGVQWSWMWTEPGKHYCVC